MSKFWSVLARTVLRVQRGGPLHRQIRTFVQPLTQREKLVYALLLMGVAGIFIAPRVTANDQQIGQLRAVPAAHCSSQNGWSDALFAAGHGEPIAKYATHIGPTGSLVCDGYNFSDEHTKRNAQLDVAALRLTQNESANPQQASEELSVASGNAQIRTIETRLKAVEPNLLEDRLAIDGEYIISLSRDGGTNWHSLHSITLPDTQEKTQVSIALPSSIFAPTTKLAFKVESATPDSTVEIAIDSLVVSYEIGPARDVSIKLANDGKEISGTQPVMNPDEAIDVAITAKNKDDGLWQGLYTKLGNNLNEPAKTDISLTATIKSEDGKTLARLQPKATWAERGLDNAETWTTQIPLQAASTEPGRYSVEIEAVDAAGSVSSVTQDFSWGVLAFNTDQDVYAPGETAQLALASLDERGRLLCDSEITIAISLEATVHQLSTEDGSIAVAETCNVKNHTDKPDYYASWQVPTLTGTYQAVITAKNANGTLEMTEDILVDQTPSIQIARRAPTRIYPVLNYPIEAHFTASASGVTTITEYVPGGFSIISNAELHKDGTLFAQADVVENGATMSLVWADVILEEGAEYSIHYVTDPPDVSPEFWQLGPLTFSGSITHSEQRSWQIASDAVGRMMLLFDGATIPSGWTCVSCLPGDPFYQRFIKASGSYGVTGGAQTHTHTLTSTVNSTTALPSNRSGAGSAISDNGHGHAASLSTAPTSNLPLHRQLRVIRASSAGLPAQLPAGAIGFFDTSVPAGWTQYAAQDGYYILGENTIGTTGGSNSHTSAISGTLAATTTVNDHRTFNGGVQVSGATSGHTHSVTGNLPSTNNEPPYYELILAKLAADSAAPANLIAMWDDTAPTDWIDMSGPAASLNNRYIKAAVVAGATGGSLQHTHPNPTLTSASTATTILSRDGGNGARATHTHQVQITANSTVTHEPPYATAYFAKYPGPPASLSQLHFRWRDDSESLNTNAGWLASEDTNITDGSKYTTYRLRISVANSSATSDTITRNYQLQYADKISTCSAAASWTSVANDADDFDEFDTIHIDPSGQATTNLFSNSEGYTFVTGAGIDVGDTASAIGPLATNTFTEIEYSFVPTPIANTGQTYCFRLYDTRLGSDLSSYAAYPEMTLDSETSLLDQDVYQFYTNNNAANPSSALADENNPILNVPSGSQVRLQLGLQTGQALTASQLSLELQFVEASDCTSATGWQAVGSTAGTEVWRGYDNPAPADGDALSTQLLLGGFPSYSTTLQTYQEENSINQPAAVSASDHGEWSIVLENNGAPDYTTYCFRITESGGAVAHYSVYPQITTGPAVAGDMLLFYSGSQIPTGWTCVSCTVGDAGYQRFVRGTATYGVQGGSQQHTHTANASVATTSSATGQLKNGAASVSELTHGHTFTPSIASSSNVPLYESLQLIKFDSGVPALIPAGAVALFDTSLPSGWSSYSAANGRYIYAQNTIGAQGGGNTHSPSVSGTLGSATGPDTDVHTSLLTEQAANAGHTHTLSGTLNGANNEPPYIESILGVADSDIALTDGITAMFTNIPNTQWQCVSCAVSDPYYQRFVKAAASYGATGGAVNHSHSDTVITSGPPSASQDIRPGTEAASNLHTHNVTISGVSTQSHLPPYLNVIFAKRASSINAPNNPTNLDQKTVTPSASIPIGNWINQTEIEFTAQATDPDDPDTLQLCVEVQPIGTAFTDTETACGSLVAYNGVAVSVSVTISGLSDNTEYHWQAHIKDVSSNASSWVSFGGNAETARDVGIDTSPPSGSVYDGQTIGIDADFNDGSLNTLHGNWSINSNVSGLAGTEYSFGTTPGATDIFGWTSTGGTSVTESSLNLNTSQLYYLNIRSTDNAGNVSVISSDGLFVAPTLSFSSSPDGVQFGELNAGNSYTATQDTVLTTSTNAYNGYFIRVFAENLLTSQTSDTIPMFTGGTYAAPAGWIGGMLGYGFTSDDPLVEGVNKFSPAICAGGGASPCYAPFATSTPGDIVADHTSTVSGTPIIDESFTITHRVTVDATQTAGIYVTTVVYNITAKF